METNICGVGLAGMRRVRCGGRARAPHILPIFGLDMRGVG